MLTISTTSVRQLVGLPEFNLGLNTSVPTLIFKYIALMLVLLRAAPLTTKSQVRSKEADSFRLKRLRIEE
ncbi:MAG: hypothetical protein ACI84R_001282 [Candidatus Azotimanducaceae bacterium]|jgi:hypothetical protein